MIPETIRLAVAQARASRPALAAAPPKSDVGELAAAKPPDSNATLQRIVAVIGRNDATATLTIQLVTSEVESASDLDLIVPPAASGLPFAIAVQTELYGPVFVEQLAASIGVLSDSHVDAVERSLLSDGETLDAFETGLPFGSSDDPRRSFKTAELRDLEEIVRECRQWLSGAHAAAKVLDPELLLPPPIGTSPDEAADRFLSLLDALDAVGNGTMSVSSELLALLDDAHLLDELPRWRTEFGLDLGRRLSVLCITELTAALPTLATDASVTTSRRTDAILEPYLQVHAAAGHAVVDILTTDFSWSQEGEVVVVQAGRRYCRGRARALEAA